MTKRQRLKRIANEIKNCAICKKDSHGKTVPGEGDADADIVFVGEAPGKEEAKTGRPFVGRSGKLLRSLIREIGFREEEVFITSPVKYLPNRGTPNKTQIAHGRIHLDKQLEIIAPKIIVLLGSVAGQGVLETKFPILKVHGKMIEESNRKYLVTLHPAAVIRFPKYLSLFRADFQKLKSLVR